MTENAHTRLPPPPVLTSRQAVFLDFDGTLAPLQDNPKTVSLPEQGDDILKRIAGICDGALAIVSGRDIRDLSSRVPTSLWRAGGHGMEICAPGETPSASPPAAPGAIAAQLDTVAAGHPGVWVEHKGPVFAIHFRAAPEAESQLADALESILHGLDGYKLQRGKMVFELKPVGANKGLALKSLMASPPFAGRIPVMAGDDATDEDAMQAAVEAGGFGVKAGAGETLAAYRLESPAAVWSWLRESVS